VIMLGAPPLSGTRGSQQAVRAATGLCFKCTPAWGRSNVIYEQSLHRRRAGTADIDLPLLFPADKTSFTALLAR
jgi:hypothetical protein